MGIESRIRQIRRAILHEKNKVVRDIFREHIGYLKTQI